MTRPSCSGTGGTLGSSSLAFGACVPTHVYFSVFHLFEKKMALCKLSTCRRRKWTPPCGFLSLKWRFAGFALSMSPSVWTAWRRSALGASQSAPPVPVNPRLASKAPLTFLLHIHLSITATAAWQRGGREVQGFLNPRSSQQSKKTKKTNPVSVPPAGKPSQRCY